MIKRNLIRTAVVPVVAAAGVALGTGLAAAPSQAAPSIGKSAMELPMAKARAGVQFVACSPCKAKSPCNPCSAKNPCNPCAPKK